MLIGGHSKANIVDLKKKLNDEFDMKDSGGANLILGMRITHDQKSR